ncbi:reverse transcriptase/maturase family protein [Butyricimonas synergistica]|uniref:reverse transcriptase/maturase family protein n=1 Tax=Butyricimonas synergistica TaxID=544644 RepID=UPI0022E8C589|nr:reverse transcriptase/maturase family protein [Butyricimonas synergistica]
MIQFEDYISADNIIDILCRLRAKLADQRHKKQLLQHLAIYKETKKTGQDRLSAINSILPPRSKWVSLKEKTRTREFITHDNRKYKQPISSFAKNKKSIKLTIHFHQKYNCNYEYLNKLNDFITLVKRHCLDPNYQINHPQIYSVSKSKIIEDRIECRPLCVFNQLVDKVIICLVNQYLSKLFDPFFYSESLAFRYKREYHGENKYTSHHDAIYRIQEFVLKNKKRNIYVAECDMEKFYDSVNHKIVKKSFYTLLRLAQKSNPDINFSCVRRIFEKYLRCYNFQRDVYKLNNNPEFWKKQEEKKGVFSWVRNELLKHGFYKNERSLIHSHIGVPQGGALSGLIANIVLNNIDQEIIKKIANKNVLYIRYCDDMILLTTNKRHCKTILNLYTKNLEKLKLVPHPFKEIDSSSNFWKEKSKAPYKWDPINRPWISFVGYEIKRNGDTRVRKKSIRKELTKQTQVVKEIMCFLKNKERVTNNSIQESLTNRLIGMSIGRVNLWNYTTMKNELCWINGFHALTYNKFASKQMKMLDAHRNILLKKVHYNLPHTGIPQNKTILSKQSLKHQRFYGKPYSYYYHYIKNFKKN